MALPGFQFLRFPPVLACSPVLVLSLSAPMEESQPALGAAGINAYALQSAPHHLTGKKIALGQVEMGRPPQFGRDKLALWPPLVVLAGVFLGEKSALENRNIEPHALQVASVLAGSSKTFRGTAPQARLYSAAFGRLKERFQENQCLALQQIAGQNGGDVRAINLSFGEPLGRDRRRVPRLDGEGLLSQCLDWLSGTGQTLMVVAGNQGKGGIPLPGDHYNGLAVAFTRPYQGEYSRLDFANLARLPQGPGRRLVRREINSGGRQSVSLVAPGFQIRVPDLKGQSKRVTGSSFAAPQVTGVVGLLQEWGDRQDWGRDYRRPEVMKAILLNSADKLRDPGDGRFLGMTRTIYTPPLRTWLQSPAYLNPYLPLDPEIGAGQLNAPRALQQLQAGQQPPGAGVKALGWDYGEIAPQSERIYVLDHPLPARRWAVATLTFPRRVDLKDLNRNRRYDLGESFRSRPLPALQLILESQTSPPAVVCHSRSSVDSVQHVFCPLPQTGRYQIRVQSPPGDFPNQAYGLAWWTAPLGRRGSQAPLPGAVAPPGPEGAGDENAGIGAGDEADD
ncbi:MAG: S8 family serine peptidase [Cyanobacteria bacterium RI_101]|nr:S8 family serine peptidase [Cyanobacteria bacterium RI_101]